MAALHLLLAAATVGLTQPVHQIEVTAKKFALEPAMIHVVAGEPVRLILRSADSVHGFAIGELKIDVQIPNGDRTVTVEFTAPPLGRYEIACSELYGSGHGLMKAALVSVAPVKPTDRAPLWIWGAAAAADGATTLHFLEGHQGRENDPLINWLPTPAATVVVGAAVDVATALLWRRLTVHHPRLQKSGFYIESAFHLFFAARNEYRIGHGGGCAVPPQCQFNCAGALNQCR